MMVLVRGDHRLNEIKLRNALGEDFRQATPEEIGDHIGPAGFIGPVAADVPVVKDAAITGEGYVCGANRPDAHLIGVAPGRDFAFEELDVRTVEAGDTAPGGGAIEIEPAIEVGNIFKLGTRYSEPLGATYLDESGAERPIVMGSYGIGPARIVAAAIEQGADEKGIVWPRSLAPWEVELVGLGKDADEDSPGGRRALRGADRRRASMSSTTTATRGPARSSPTPSSSAARCASSSASARWPRAQVEAQERRLGGGSQAPAGRGRRSACAAARGLESRGRRAVGGRGRGAASGASLGSIARAHCPPQTRAGAPLRPFTLPNLVGYLRLAAIPLFLYLALSSDDGRVASADAPLPVDHAGRLPGRLPRSRHRPVLAHGRPAGPDRRPAERPCRRDRLLALRLPAALGAAPPRGRARW